MVVDDEMAEETALVLRHLKVYEGVDFIAVLRRDLPRWRASHPEERRSLWLADPALSLVSPEIEWQSPGGGNEAAVYHGWQGINDYFTEWLEAWESYTYEVVSQRQLGSGRVLSVLRLRAQARRATPGDDGLRASCGQRWPDRLVRGIHGGARRARVGRCAPITRSGGVATAHVGPTRRAIAWGTPHDVFVNEDQIRALLRRVKGPRPYDANATRVRPARRRRSARESRR